jgi:hypothetical protein
MLASQHLIAQEDIADLECVDYKLLRPCLGALLTKFYGLLENDT